jgi:hypothetical protein
MLHLASPIVDDEPVSAPAPVEDKATIGLRETNRRACKFWSVVKDHLFDLHGRSLVRQLGPGFVPQDPSKPRIPIPTLREFRGPMPWTPTTEAGSWFDLGTGARGDDLIALVEFLGACSRPVAAAYLKDLTDRLVEIAK